MDSVQYRREVAIPSMAGRRIASPNVLPLFNCPKTELHLDLNLPPKAVSVGPSSWSQPLISGPAGLTLHKLDNRGQESFNAYIATTWHCCVLNLTLTWKSFPAWQAGSASTSAQCRSDMNVTEIGARLSTSRVVQ